MTVNCKMLSLFLQYFSDFRLFSRTWDVFVGVCSVWGFFAGRERVLWLVFLNFKPHRINQIHTVRSDHLRHKFA